MFGGKIFESQKIIVSLLEVFNFGDTYAYSISSNSTSSETQGQIVGARESLNGRKDAARRKVKNGEKSSSRRSFLFFVPHFSARLDFPSPRLSAPGSRRIATQKLHDVFSFFVAPQP